MRRTSPEPGRLSRYRAIVTNTATAATTYMIVRMRKRIGGIGFIFQSHQSFAVLPSMIVTTGDRPGLRIVETNPARSSVSKPREAENRERPNSYQLSLRSNL
jgi:hypothetical protein